MKKEELIRLIETRLDSPGHVDPMFFSNKFRCENCRFSNIQKDSIPCIFCHNKSNFVYGYTVIKELAEEICKKLGLEES